jgi:hypothetical protein
VEPHIHGAGTAEFETKPKPAGELNAILKAAPLAKKFHQVHDRIPPIKHLGTPWGDAFKNFDHVPLGLLCGEAIKNFDYLHRVIQYDVQDDPIVQKDVHHCLIAEVTKKTKRSGELLAIGKAAIHAKQFH